MSLHAIVDAHNQGFDENMYLVDSATRTNVEETGGANFIFVTKDQKVVTPKSDSILPSITRRSIMYVAKEYLGLETEEREVPLKESKILQSVGCVVRRQSSRRSGRLWIMAKRSACRAVWMRWDRLQKNCMIH